MNSIIGKLCTKSKPLKQPDHFPWSGPCITNGRSPNQSANFKISGVKNEKRYADQKQPGTRTTITISSLSDHVSPKKGLGSGRRRPEMEGLSVCQWLQAGVWRHLLDHLHPGCLLDNGPMRFHSGAVVGLASDVNRLRDVPPNPNSRAIDKYPLCNPSIVPTQLYDT